MNHITTIITAYFSRILLCDFAYSVDILVLYFEPTTFLKNFKSVFKTQIEMAICFKFQNDIPAPNYSVRLHMLFNV